MTEPSDIDRRNVFVPVAIDAERLIDGETMLRSTYFLAITDSPSSIWEIDLPTVARLHGLGALGMLGVVFSVLRQTEDVGREVTSFGLFVDAADISAIFALEEEGDVSIQLEDVWLPRRWCRAAPSWGGEDNDAGLHRGDVFRVSARLFQWAYRYAAGELELETLLAQRVDGELFRSPAETAALRRWSEQQIEETRRAFPDKEVKLRVRSS